MKQIKIIAVILLALLLIDSLAFFYFLGQKSADNNKVESDRHVVSLVNTEPLFCVDVITRNGIRLVNAVCSTERIVGYKHQN